MIFANCSVAAINNGSSAVSSLHQFVQNGGSFYASDWAYTYISNAFPNHIDFYGNDPRIGYSGTVSGDIVDPGLASYLNPDLPPSNIMLNYNLSSWVVIDSVSSSTVLMRGDVQTSSGLLHDKPLAVAFNPYGDNSGKVIYTTFHNEAQQSNLEKKLIEYMVLVPTTSDLVADAEQFVEASGVYVKQTNINTIDPGEISPIFSYYLSEETKLVFVNNWAGSTLKMSVFAPDGSLYEEVTSSTPPTTVVIPNAQAGKWGYQITGMEVPYQNYPYVVVIGDDIVHLAYIPSILQNYKPLTIGFSSQFNDSPQQAGRYILAHGMLIVILLHSWVGERLVIIQLQCKFLQF